jgi:DNA-binding transcriptional regulator YiaG
VSPFCHVTFCAIRPLDPRYPATLNTIGDHLKQKRLVARRIGVDKSSIQYWETNQVTPAICHMPWIIEFLGYAPYIPAHTFAEELFRTRWYLGLSRRRLAAMLKLDESNLAGCEAGRHQPAKKSMNTIGAFFNSAFLIEFILLKQKQMDSYPQPAQPCFMRTTCRL